ncbi:MAG: hypothetical protein IJ899_21445 [Blautia sp.]|nr:hypothetical protein [Blautia sp.]
MEKWTKEELEELFQKANQKAKEDEEFRKEAKQDLKAALEKLAGRELPEGMQLEMVASGELDDEAAEKAAGGQSDNCLIDLIFPKYEGCPEFCALWSCGGYMCAAKAPCLLESIGPCAAYTVPCAAFCVADFCTADICAALA